MFAGIGIGLFLIVVGCTWWKLGMAPRATPWSLLIGSSVLTGTTIVSLIRSILGKGATMAATLGGHWVAGLSSGLLLLLLATIVSIYLYCGIHPKKGQFRRSHNVAALVAPVVWIAAGGVFATIVTSLATAANHAGSIFSTLGR